MPTGGITLVVGNSGQVQQSFEVEAIAPFTPITLAFEVVRDWVDFCVGVLEGDEDIVAPRRLYPGYHFQTFTPATSCYVTFKADTYGTRYISEPELITDVNMTIATPYSVEEAAEVKMMQSENAVFMFHRAHAPYVLERWDQYSWSMRKFLPNNGPFKPVNISNVQLAPNVRLGSGQVSATLGTGEPARFFRDGMEDSLLKIIHGGQSVYFAVSAEETYSNYIRVFGVGAERHLEWTTTGTFVGTLALFRSIGNPDNFTYLRDIPSSGYAYESDLFDNQVLYYRFGFKDTTYVSGEAVIDAIYAYGSTTGIARITAVVSESVANVQVLEQFGKITYSRDWFAGAWSEADGWPVTGSFQDDRLFAFRSTNRWGSQPNTYEDFSLDDTDAGAIDRVSKVGKPSEAVWSKSAGPLVIGSKENESVLGTGALDEAITPTTIRARLISGRGSNGADAVVIDTKVVWPSASGKRLYELDFAEGAPLPRDLTRLHTEIAGGGFREITFQVEPEPRIWGVRQDGQLAVMLYERIEGVEGWHRYRRGADVWHSIVAHPEPTEDRMMMVVDRQIGDVTRRFLEVTETENRSIPKRDQHRLQCVIVYEDTEIDEDATETVITGLGHLEGAAVIAFADGRSHQDTVEDASITVPWRAEKVYVGLEAEAPYLSPILAYASGGGTALTQPRKVHTLGISVKDTPPGILLVGDSLDDMIALEDRLDGEGGTLTMDDEQQTMTGIAMVGISSSWSLNAKFAIKATLAGPATIVFIVPHMEGGNR